MYVRCGMTKHNLFLSHFSLGNECNKLLTSVFAVSRHRGVVGSWDSGDRCYLRQTNEFRPKVDSTMSHDDVCKFKFMKMKLSNPRYFFSLKTINQCKIKMYLSSKSLHIMCPVLNSDVEIEDFTCELRSCDSELMERRTPYGYWLR